MSTATLQLPADIRSYLRRFIVRRRTFRAIRKLGQILLLVIVWTLVCCLLDRMLALPWGVRLMMLSLLVAYALVSLIRMVSRTIRRMDPVRAASQIERREPRFAQRLSTVASRLSGPEEFRGSAHLLDALTNEVSRDVHAGDSGPLVPWLAALRPWMTVLVIVALIAPLWRVQWLDMPTLLTRFTKPLAPALAVTTTRLAVRPGNVEVAEGASLRVRVTAERLGESTPSLHVRSVGEVWHAQAMVAMPDGAFEARVNDLDRDLEYFVTGGDAMSELFTALILPKPAVAVFRIRYAFPAYTGIPSREVENTTGVIEAPAGADVTLMIEATQPLDAAVMTIGGEGVPTTPTARPEVREARFTVRDDRRYTIRMASARGVSGAFRGGTIRALPDRPPIVRLNGIDGHKRVGRGDIVQIPYQTVDDYGLSRLDLEAGIGRADGRYERIVRVVPIGKGARQQAEIASLDLGPLGLHADDKLEIRLRAEDRAGQFALSDPLNVTVSRLSAERQIAVPTSAPARPIRPADAPPLDPPGFVEALKAYFDALRQNDARNR